MQKLIGQLTVALTERDEELSMERTLCRQLRESLDHATLINAPRSQPKEPDIIEKDGVLVENQKQV